MNIKSKEEWAKLVEEYKQSGLSIGDFCRARGLKNNTFDYHVKTKLEGKKKHSPAKTNGSNFVKVGGSSSVTITFPNGVTAQIPTSEASSILKGLI